MQILTRYIAKEYLQYFSLCFFSLTSIGLTFAALSELELLKKAGGGSLFIQSLLSSAPLLIELILPIAVLLATILTYSSFSKSSEAVAMQAGGFSPFNLVRPVLVLGLAIGGFAYFNQSYLAPWWGADAKLLLMGKIKEDHAWRYFQEKLYYFEGLNEARQEAKAGRIFAFNAYLQFKSEELVEDLKQADGQIRYEVKKIIQFYPLRLEEESGYLVKLQAKAFPKIFLGELAYPRYSNFGALITRLLAKQEGGENTSADFFAFFQKISGFLSFFLMILLALPFSLFSHRAGNVRGGILVAILLGFVYWLLEQIFSGLFKAGLLPPFVAAFGAFGLYTLLCFGLLKRRLG